MEAFTGPGVTLDAMPFEVQPPMVCVLWGIYPQTIRQFLTTLLYILKYSKEEEIGMRSYKEYYKLPAKERQPIELFMSHAVWISDFEKLLDTHAQLKGFGVTPYVYAELGGGVHAGRRRSISATAVCR